jgi:hypothetical protein
VPEHLGALAVHREDGAPVSEAEQVVEGDRAELSRMARHARDHHAARVEERAEALEQPRGIERRSRRRRRRGGRADLHQGVDGDRKSLADDQRVQVDAAHVGAFQPEASETDEEARQRVTIDRGLAAEPAEEHLRAQTVDHACGLAGTERRRREDDVAERLGEDAPETEDDAGPELRIAYETGDELAAPAHLLGDEQLHGAVVRPREREQLDGRRAHGGSVGQSQPDEVALGLVRDGVAAQLEHDRETDRLGGAGGPGGVRGEGLARQRDAVARDERLRCMLGERRACGIGGHAGGQPFQRGDALSTPRLQVDAGAGSESPRANVVDDHAEPGSAGEGAIGGHDRRPSLPRCRDV